MHSLRKRSRTKTCQTSNFSFCKREALFRLSCREVYPKSLQSEEAVLHALWTKDTKDLICKIVGAASKTKLCAIDRIMTNKRILFTGLFSLAGFADVGLQRDYEITSNLIPGTADTHPAEELELEDDITHLAEELGLEDDITHPVAGLETEVTSSEESSTHAERPPRRLLRPVLVTDGIFVNLIVPDTRWLRPRRVQEAKDDPTTANSDSGGDVELADILGGVNEDLGKLIPAYQRRRRTP